MTDGQREQQQAEGPISRREVELEETLQILHNFASAELAVAKDAINKRDWNLAQQLWVSPQPTPTKKSPQTLCSRAAAFAPRFPSGKRSLHARTHRSPKGTLQLRKCVTRAAHVRQNVFQYGSLEEPEEEPPKS